MFGELWFEYCQEDLGRFLLALYRWALHKKHPIDVELERRERLLAECYGYDAFLDTINELDLPEETNEWLG